MSVKKRSADKRGDANKKDVQRNCCSQKQHETHNNKWLVFSLTREVVVVVVVVVIVVVVVVVVAAAVVVAVGFITN